MSPARRGTGIEGLRRGAGLDARMAEVQASVDEASAQLDEIGAPPARPRPEKPVRFTLDLDRARHQDLKRYALSIETDASRVVRALLDELAGDPGLAARVQARIWNSGAV